ncbi:hypothetical protein [Geodermatophilus sp. SYSU D00710]
MQMKVEPSVQALIPLEDRNAWERALHGIPHAFGHTWANCRAMQLTTGWPTFLYTWEAGSARVVCAVAERGEEGLVDVVTPYGFGGFVGIGAMTGMLKDWDEFARERGYVCAYIGLHPELAPAVCRSTTDYYEHNDVYILELDSGVDVLHRGLSSNRRRQLRAFDSGAARLVDDRPRLEAFFLDNVADFMARKGASATYSFSDRTWHALLREDAIFLLGAESPEGDLAAVCVFAYTAYSGEYLFGISRTDGDPFSAPLLWAGAVMLTDMGIPRLNLGGGVRRGDGIAEFKQRFGGRRWPLGALKQVFRPAVYADLSRAVGADPSDRTGFFPPFRASGALAADVSRRLS